MRHGAAGRIVIATITPPTDMSTKPFTHTDATRRGSAARARAFFILVPLLLLALSAVRTTAYAQTAADSGAIKAVVLDYALGWYEGEPARVVRALHPRLAKRSVARDSAGRSQLVDMPIERLIGEARAGVGRQVPASVRRTDVRILDVYGDIASVRGDMHGWVDYFQVARLDGEWKVVNVLWALRPEFASGPRRVVGEGGPRRVEAP